MCLLVVVCLDTLRGYNIGMMGIQTVEDSKGLCLWEYPPHSTIPPGQDKPSMIVEMVLLNVHSFRIEINVYSVKHSNPD